MQLQFGCCHSKLILADSGKTIIYDYHQVYYMLSLQLLNFAWKYVETFYRTITEKKNKATKLKLKNFSMKHSCSASSRAISEKRVQYLKKLVQYLKHWSNIGSFPVPLSNLFLKSLFNLLTMQ